MKKKLTLTIDESVTRKAKRMAKKEGTSVSEIVEQYLSDRTSSDADWIPSKNANWTADLLGSVRMTDEEKKNEEYKKVKERDILRKYDS